MLAHLAGGRAYEEDLLSHLGFVNLRGGVALRGRRGRVRLRGQLFQRLPLTAQLRWKLVSKVERVAQNVTRVEGIIKSWTEAHLDI